MKTVSRMMIAAAASSLAFAPIAAQAATRASDGGQVYSVSTPGMGRAAQGESAKSGSSIILALIGAGVFFAGLFFAFDSDDNGQSPGT